MRLGLRPLVCLVAAAIQSYELFVIICCGLVRAFLTLRCWITTSRPGRLSPSSLLIRQLRKVWTLKWLASFGVFHSRFGKLVVEVLKSCFWSLDLLISAGLPKSSRVHERVYPLDRGVVWHHGSLSLDLHHPGQAVRGLCAGPGRAQLVVSGGEDDVIFWAWGTSHLGWGWGGAALLTQPRTRMTPVGRIT